MTFCQKCTKPAKWAGAWKSATMPAPAFVYCCDGHKGLLEGCYTTRELGPDEHLTEYKGTIEQPSDD
jgi:hypothetical protein